MQNNSCSSRYFNNVQLIQKDGQDYIIKSSKDKNKIFAEYQWYNTVNTTSNCIFNSMNTIYVPFAKDYYENENEAGFTLPYINGTTLKDILVHNKISDCRKLYKHSVTQTYIIEACLRELYYLIENSKRSVFISDYKRMLIESMYTDKTFKRLSETSLDLDKSYIINRIKTPTIRELVNESYVEVNNHDIRDIVHGDLCFSNILLFKQVVKPIKWALIDPRGMLTSNNFTTIGDIKYDIGKLAHSIIGLYDNIIEDVGFYTNKIDEYSYDYYIHIPKEHIELQDIFKNEFHHYEKYYYDIMIHLFLSMIPLHKDRPDHQEKMLVNAFRIYFLKHNIIL